MMKRKTDNGYNIQETANKFSMNMVNRIKVIDI